MNVLVTGGSGFVGRHLCAALKSAGAQVTAPGSRECDLTSDGGLDGLTGGPFDLVYHLAAWTRAGEFCQHHSGEQWVINQRINTNVLDWWRRKQPQAKLVAFGTSVSYASEEDLSEGRYMLGTPSDKFFAYAMSKRMLYAGLLSMRKQWGLNYLYLVPSTVYGPGYHTDGRPMHFIYDLAVKILRGRYEDQPVVLWGDGGQRRELVYIEDFIRILTSLAASHQNDIVNVGAGQDYTIREFAAALCAETGYDPARIQYDTTQYVGARSKFLATAKLRGLMPGLRMTPLAEGMRATLEWCRQSGQFLKKT